MNDFLSRVYFDNTVQEYLIALGIILGGVLALQLFKKIILTRLKKWSEKTQSNLDNFAVAALEKFALPALNFFIIYVGINYLELSEKTAKVIKVAVAVLITFFLLRLISSIVLHGLQSYVRRQEQGDEKVKQLGGIMLIMNAVIWIIGIIFLFDNLGYNVGTIIAGLGIGGIAIALAAQNILGDLFNYFVIFFDRPFEIGDFIILDDKMGTVEYIGIKTTRVKSLSGEQLILSNSDLTKSRVHNYKRMERRRIEFNIGIVYETPLEKIQEVPSIIKEIITSIDGLTLDRTHFKGYGDFSLIFQTVYFVESPDFNYYMDRQQTINLRLYEEFQKRKIEFAYPTQSVFLTPTNKENHKEQMVSGHH
jgi:small-conductance mechanosensitive channel